MKRAAKLIVSLRIAESFFFVTLIAFIIRNQNLVPTQLFIYVRDTHRTINLKPVAYYFSSTIVSVEQITFGNRHFICDVWLDTFSRRVFTIDDSAKAERHIDAISTRMVQVPVPVASPLYQTWLLPVIFPAIRGITQWIPAMKNDRSLLREKKFDKHGLLEHSLCGSLCQFVCVCGKTLHS